MNEDRDQWRDYYAQCAQLEDEYLQTAKFDVLPVHYRAIVKEIKEKLDLRNSDFLVDVGCGNGLIDIALAKVCRKAVGVDFSHPELRHAVKKSRQSPNIDYVCGEACHIPLPDSCADKVLLYSVTMHFGIEIFAQVVGELIRICRPGGLILVGDNVSETRYGRRKRDLIGMFREYCALNPEKLSLIPLRVALFHAAKKVRQFQVNSNRRAGLSARRHVSVPQDFELADEEGSLRIVKQLGQSGVILQQNFRLPYARYRYDLLIRVSKQEQ